MEIKFYNRQTKSLQTEKVYGDKAVQFLYDSALGRALWPLVTGPAASKAYGFYQNLPLSKGKVRPFIEKFDIPMDLYLPQEGREENDPYANFNQFFIRKFKPGKRPIEQASEKMPAFSEARYFAWSEIQKDQTFPVKGNDLSAEQLLENEKWSSVFEGGPLMIARLCPVDYHRFHYPDSGKVIDHWNIPGAYHSVNPLALQFKSDIFCTNERMVSILETKNFGRLAYIEVGATCVGKIIQSHSWDKPFERGEEKGYFLFGGSTVILLGEKGLWSPSEDILKRTQEKIETWVPLGEEVAHLN
jgi:phosphatidylserine decarboxylase